SALNAPAAQSVPALGPPAVEPGSAKSAAAASTATTTSPIGPLVETVVSENAMPRRSPGRTGQSATRRSHTRPAWVPNDVLVRLVPASGSGPGGVPLWERPGRGGCRHAVVPPRSIGPCRIDPGT